MLRFLIAMIIGLSLFACKYRGASQLKEGQDAATMPINNRLSYTDFRSKTSELLKNQDRSSATQPVLEKEIQMLLSAAGFEREVKKASQGFPREEDFAATELIYSSQGEGFYQLKGFAGINRLYPDGRVFSDELAVFGSKIELRDFLKDTESDWKGDSIIDRSSSERARISDIFRLKLVSIGIVPPLPAHTRFMVDNEYVNSRGAVEIFTPDRSPISGYTLRLYPNGDYLYFRPHQQLR